MHEHIYINDMFRLIQSLVILLSLFSCSDYALHPKVDREPDIDVNPTTVDFGSLNAGYELSLETITISNAGNEVLNINAIKFNLSTSVYSITNIISNEIEPGKSTDLIVSYDPITYESNINSISILSDDPDEEIVTVNLSGKGDAPVIEVDPAAHDLGTVYLGCDDSFDITISNIGNANLEINDIRYYVTVPVDFSMIQYEIENGPLPWIIAPSDSLSLTIYYTPLDLLSDDAYVEIVSSDPLNPVVMSDHSALGAYEYWVIDNFTQDGEAIVDILFVVDNSGSMSSNQTNLKNNFGDFMSVFVGAGVDYQVALITTDDASFVGNIITPATPDPVAEFSNQVDAIGYHGAPIEKGLWYSYESTATGGDAAPGSATGFFRASARLVVVYVSDEPDASTNTSAYGGGSAGMTPSDYSTHLQSLKSSHELVVAHAVAGDYPSGCTSNGSAQFGDGYYDVVADLGGTFMSICAADWSVTMDTLARDSMSMLSFPLSDYPIEDTIIVSVDGLLSADWTYDTAANSVSFTVAPADESSIDIQYAAWADCDTGE